LRVVDDILTAAERLSDFPFSGGVVEAYGLESVRQIFVGDYRVVYEVEDEVVQIWMVIHTRRRFRRVRSRTASASAVSVATESDLTLVVLPDTSPISPPSSLIPPAPVAARNRV
jgi:mRNA-degrading endonuclease RelE of RelBE toxin-antitoxin system